MLNKGHIRISALHLTLVFAIPLAAQAQTATEPTEQAPIAESGSATPDKAVVPETRPADQTSTDAAPASETAATMPLPATKEQDLAEQKAQPEEKLAGEEELAAKTEDAPTAELPEDETGDENKEEEPAVELSARDEAALKTLAGSNEDPEVERRARKQAEKEALYQMEREEDEQAPEQPTTPEESEQAAEGVSEAPDLPKDEGPAQARQEESAAQEASAEAAQAVEVPAEEPVPEREPEPDPEPETETETETELEVKTDHRPGWDYDFYGSLRLHGINTFDLESESSETKLGDGASRIGFAGYLETASNWEFYGRLEAGFDILDTFTPKAQFDTGAKLPIRLAHLGVDSEYFNLKAGKSWSAYYKVAGAADLFSIFGASAMGIYNAGTDGGATGTGRADEALQTQIYVDLGKWIDFKPFNVNLQYQWDQPIPRLDNEKYDNIYSVSTWFEHWNDIGVGFAYHRASVEEDKSPEVIGAGIDGNTTASAVAVKSYGDRWLVSAVLGKHENLETNDLGQYVDGEAYELFFQRRFGERVWLIAGGNWFLPEDDDPEAGEFKIAYGVLGARYTFDGLHRMIYAEWKSDHGRGTLGVRRDNEFTVGVRWDFGY